MAEVEDWAGGLETLLTRIGPRFARAEPRARAGVYVPGSRGRDANTFYVISQHAPDHHDPERQAGDDLGRAGGAPHRGRTSRPPC